MQKNNTTCNIFYGGMLFVSASFGKNDAGMKALVHDYNFTQTNTYSGTKIRTRITHMKFR